MIINNYYSSGGGMVAWRIEWHFLISLQICELTIL